MSEHIVLIGPPGIDLAAVGQQVADNLKLPLRSPEDFTDADWTDMGFDMTADIMAFAQGGAYASYRLWMPMRLRFVEKLLASPECSVIVLSPECVVQEDGALQDRLAANFSKYPFVFLLTPSPDSDETADLLDADLINFPDWSAVNADYINNPSNERLARHIVYTKGKTEAQTRDEILALRRDVAPSDIILIGPKLAGKTTLGRMLANALGIPQVSLDYIEAKYLSETDYDNNIASKIFHEEGIFGLLRYRRPYEAYMVERLLSDESGCVIDFGGRHTVYEDEALFQRVAKALAPYPNVVLILPSPDKEESIRILKERFETDVASERKLQRLLVTHPSYTRMAKQVIYTKDKEVEALSAKVIAAVTKASSPDANQ